MKYMLDTNICSYVIKHRPKEVLAKFNTLQIDDSCISVITLAELRYWVVRNKRLHQQSQNQGVPKVNEEIINDFVAHLFVADFDSHAAKIYAEVRDYFTAKGKVVGSADLMIGSHAISLGLTLVTNNVKDFESFPKLRLENWIKP